MALARRTSRLRFAVALLVLVSLTLITLDASGRASGAFRAARSGFSGAITPVQRVIHSALRPVGNFLTGAVDYGTLEQDNARLRSELAHLRTQQAASAFAQQQADQVLRLQHLPFAAGVPSVTAAIIDLGSSNFASTVTVDRGRDNGVSVGQPVVAAGGLAGTVSAVTAHDATITLVTDPSFVAGVDLPGGNTGSAAGQGPGQPLRVTVLPRAGLSGAPAPVVAVGSVLITSGLSMEHFPAGIPVGRVSSAAVPAGETDPVISLRPVVDPASLRYLDILLWSPQ